MPPLFPSEPKKLRERIRRYERELEREFASGYGGDGFGKRYLLGPLYLLAGDVEGALASFEWYEETFPDDSGDPWQYLAWALALYRGRQWDAASVRLYRTMLQNLYLIPHLLGDKPPPLAIWHGCNLAEIEYALETPPELLALWSAEERAWARQVSQQPAVVQRVTRYIEIARELKREPPGRRRTALVNEAYRLKRSDLEDEE
ncbi:MAG TPA: hypothetical protein VMF30_00050 [Pirellulales bacterium]|nr:hypothetical protein [Pirellulales bacterium]